MTPESLPPEAQMMNFILAKWISKPIYAAAVLGIADLLADGPRTATDLAERLDVHADALYRLLRSDLTGSVVELPNVIPLLQENIAKNNLEERMQAIPCDFFRCDPPRSDAYLLSHVLHDWPDEVCVRILTRCRRAMGPDTRIIIIEGIVPSGNDFSIAKQLDLEVLLMGGGKERTIEAFEELLRRSGLRLANRVDTRDYISVLEGVASPGT